MIQVMVVDDHAILVEGLSRLVNESGFATVMGTAYTGKNCLEQLRLQQPDVLLLDINLPDVSGLDLCKTIKYQFPTVKVVALTSYSEYAMVRQMLENGANGYVIKNAMPDEILMSIQVVHAGELFLCEQVDVFMKRQADTAIWLTNREKQLLSLIVEGYTNPEIASKMFLGVETINSYRKNLLCKLGARNTAVMVKMAIEGKLI
jgi:DNA-binding NarL/FixJ family response regulator